MGLLIIFPIILIIIGIFEWDTDYGLQKKGVFTVSNSLELLFLLPSVDTASRIMIVSFSA